MILVQKKIAVGMDVLKFFTMNNWNFKSDNFQNLLKVQSPEEHDMFLIDSECVDVQEYLKLSMVGGRQYCARDPLSTIPKAKIIVRV